RALARQVNDRRAAQALERSAWMLPLVTALGGALVFYLAHRTPDRLRARWPEGVRMATVVYCAAAVAVGAAATAAVLRLLATTAALAMGTWFRSGADAMFRHPTTARRLIVAASRDWGRWACIAGLALW